MTHPIIEDLLDTPWTWILAVPAMFLAVSIAQAAPAEPTVSPITSTAPAYVWVPAQNADVPYREVDVGQAAGMDPPPTLPPLSCGNVYVAQPGDSWWRIAGYADVDPYILLDYNNAQPETLILIGDPICLPPGTVITSTTTAPNTPPPTSTLNESPANESPTVTESTSGSMTSLAPTPTPSFESPSTTTPTPTSATFSPEPSSTTSSHERWLNPIPSYRPGGACSQSQADTTAHKFRHEGASDDTITWALTVFSRESNCDHTSYNFNDDTGDESYSLCMANAKSGVFTSIGKLAGWSPNKMLTSFDYALDACVELWTSCGRGPWRYGAYYCERPTS